MKTFLVILRLFLLLWSIAGTAGALRQLCRTDSSAPPRREFDLELRYALNLPPPEKRADREIPRADRKIPRGDREIPRPYASMIARAAAKYGFRPALIAGIIERESGFDPRITAPDGGQGLMQLMPEVRRERRCPDPFDPEANIETGTAHLAALYEALESVPDPEERVSFALAAYNGGLGHVFDARQVAKELKLDPDRWEENVEEAIQFLKFRSFYSRFRHGSCRADLIVNYVRSVRALEEAFTPRTQGE